MDKLNSVYLSLGSNLGDKKKNIIQAIDLLKHDLRIEKISSFYETEPIGYKKQNNFYNIVIKGKTLLSPETLLKKIKDIEDKLGRKKIIKWGPRKIDIDILLYDNVKRDTPYLKIPHPEIKNRRFVLEPLFEISPLIKIDGERIKNLLEKNKNQGVVKL